MAYDSVDACDQLVRRKRFDEGAHDRSVARTKGGQEGETHSDTIREGRGNNTALDCAAMNDSQRMIGANGGDPEVVATLGIGQRHVVARVIKWSLLVVAVVGLILGGVLLYRRSQTRGLPTYRTQPVVRSDIQVTISATGTVTALSTVEVGAEVSGKVVKVNVDYNDRVKKGDVLAEIDPEQLKAAVDEATARVRQSEAEIRQAKATLAEAKQNLVRAEAQLAQGLISQKDVEAARAAAARAEASLSSAMASATVSQATLKSAKNKLDKSVIVSPIDGIVLARLVEPGQTVTAGFQTPLLFKLAEDLRRMRLTVYVDEADIGRAKEGQEASFTVDAFPDRVFPSRVLSLRNEPKTDQNVVSYEAVLAVDNSELLLRPGMTATATIISDTRKDVLAVPNAALRFVPPAARKLSIGMSGRPRETTEKSAQKKGARVWVLDGLNPVEVPVKTGASDGTLTEIVKGELAVGMEVVVDAVEKK